MTRLLLVVLALLFAAPAFAVSHHHRYHRDRYYDGPRDTYGTRWYGENAGTVHYGY